MLDPRDSFVRVRSIFTILQSSGHYFTGGNAHSKLKKYFVFLQLYLLTKEDLPADLQTIFHTLHAQLLPEANLYYTYEDAEKRAREYIATDEHDPDPDSGSPKDSGENDAARDNQQPAELAEASADATEDPDAADQAEDDLFEKELASIIPGQVRCLSVACRLPRVAAGVRTTCCSKPEWHEQARNLARIRNCKPVYTFPYKLCFMCLCVTLA